MAIDRYQDEIATSLRGNDLGFDRERRLAGMTGVRFPTEFLTAASTMATNGLTALSGSTATFTIQAPLVAGVEKIIVNASTLSTAVMTVVRSTAAGACAFLGSTANGAASGVSVTLQAQGASVRLISISSDVWATVGNVGNITSSGKIMNITTSS
jgi:hypothetical protein